MSEDHQEYTTRDFGLLLRLTPYDSVLREGDLPDLDELLAPVLGGVRCDLAYGHAVLNDSEGNGQDESYFLVGAKDTRDALALRLATGLPRSIDTWLRDGGVAWLAASLTPLVSLGVTWDRVRTVNIHFDGEGGAEIDERFRGWELTLANFASVRGGKMHRPGSGFAKARTSGWGIALNFAD